MQTEISKCCKAQVKLGGDEGEGTHYYICSKCNNPCDLYYEEETEILKMSDNNLVEKFEEECIHQWSSGDKLIIREELLKRLSKNKPEIWSYTNITPEQAVEEFKKKLLDEIDNLFINTFSDSPDTLIKRTKIKIKEIITNLK